MKNNVEAFKKLYKDATKNEIIEDMFLDICQRQMKLDKIMEYIKQREKDDDNWVDYELLIEPVILKEIIEGD